ncbi:type II toxin-antitoxin system RatA family toxin [Amycolatopsis sp. NPDC059090]|uniref:type II toxin-antitoxin system RatA family toxin n=1 Tax=unclassified Amycolatopsis TaxID=2618356 RepID=UPI00366C7EE7
MGDVKVSVDVPGVGDLEVFGVLSDFSAYPQATDAVRAVTIGEADGGPISSWEVNFRKGILKWVERDDFDLDERVISFVQTEGDLTSFSGHWRVVPRPSGGVTVTFDARFDLGMPTIASIVDPIAERTLMENTRTIIEQLVQPGRLAARTTSTAEPTA